MHVGKLASGAARMRQGGARLLRSRRRRHPVLSLGLAMLACLGLLSSPAAAQSAPGDSQAFVHMIGDTPGHLDLGAGVYDIIGNSHRNETGGADVEYRFGQKFYFIGPAMGVIADARGGGMVYAAIYGDIAAGPLIITPLGGAGAWWHGAHNDENLGGTFEFRLSFEVAYPMADGSRLGLRFGHISSADLNKTNPGENDLMLTYSLPLGF